jgi:hypothetical protein
LAATSPFLPATADLDSGASANHHADRGGRLSGLLLIAYAPPNQRTASRGKSDSEHRHLVAAISVPETRYWHHK